ncbi:hypothetical protein [Mammaliicoccus sp. D-M17]|uniref:hypothetical protein n=1 Tax=Mammaliicoccus sp. D-M17 TaxID=2898677 RepID=UPI001EFA6C1A|nr:hypothetical protein [Mammaliicoccus sp. D-M17]
MFNKSKIVNIKGNDYLVLKNELKNMKQHGFSEISAMKSLKQLESVGLAEIIEFKGENYIRIFEPQKPNKPFNVLRLNNVFKDTGYKHKEFIYM